MAATSSSRPSPAPTRTPSRRASSGWRRTPARPGPRSTASRGASHICRSTRTTWAVPTRPWSRSTADLWAKFEDEYLPTPDNPWGRFRLASTRIDAEEDGETHLVVGLRDRSVPGTEVTTVEGHGNGPIAAFVDALAQFDVDVRVLDYAEHAMSAGGDAKAAAYVECAVGERVLWGVGVDSSIVRASLKAIVSAVNRALRPAEVRG